MSSGRSNKPAPNPVIKAFTPIVGPSKRYTAPGYQPGVIVIRPRQHLAQYFHAPTEADRDAMATHILYWLRKTVKYFTIPKRPEPLEFDPQDIASFPQYLRQAMQEQAANFAEKEKAHIYWTERTREIDVLLYEGTYTRSPWEILLSVYTKAFFQPYEKVECIFNIHPSAQADPQLID